MNKLCKVTEKELLIIALTLNSNNVMICSRLTSLELGRSRTVLFRVLYFSLTIIFFINNQYFQ